MRRSVALRCRYSERAAFAALVSSARGQLVWLTLGLTAGDFTCSQEEALAAEEAALDAAEVTAAAAAKAAMTAPPELRRAKGADSYPKPRVSPPSPPPPPPISIDVGAASTNAASSPTEDARPARERVKGGNSASSLGEALAEVAAAREEATAAETEATGSPAGSVEASPRKEAAFAFWGLAESATFDPEKQREHGQRQQRPAAAVAES